MGDFHAKLSRRKAMTFEIVEAIAKIVPVDLEKHRAILSRVVAKGSWILCCAVVGTVVLLLNIHHWAS